jgi:serine/threonine-protein kinase
MAPERFDASTAADQQGDVFAFCVALYEVLYGGRPFEGATIDELRAAVATPPKQPQGTAVPAWLHAVIVRGVNADRGARYRSMPEVLRALQPPRRARARWIAAALVTLAATAGVLDWRSTRATAAPPATCDARAELAGTWDAATRDRIRTAWTTTPAGQLAWPRLQRALDSYADTWVGASDAACKAPSTVARVADFQHRCLRSLAAKLRGFTDQLVDTSLIATADGQASTLPSVEGCSSSAPIPPEPSNPQIRVEVDALREQLASAVGESLAGKFAAAGQRLAALAALAAPIGFKPLSAEIGYERAMTHRSLSTKPDAQFATMREVAAQAEASGDEPLAVKAWLGLAFDAGDVGGDFARGHEYASYARAALERLGGNAHLEAELEIEDGRLFAHEHKLDDARRELGHAADLVDAGQPVHIAALAELADVDLTAGRYAESLGESLHVLEQCRKLYGEVRSCTAEAYTSLGEVTDRMGRLEESLDYYQRADAISQQVFGPGHPAVQQSAHNLGFIYSELERFDDAERELRRAVRIADEVFGPDHPHTVNSEASLGDVLVHRKQYAEAIRLIRHAIKVDVATYGEQGAETIIADDELAIALRTAGQLDEALVYADKAIAGFTALDGADSANLAEGLDTRARVLLAMHRNRDAAAEFDKSADIYAHTQAPAKKVDDERELAAKARGR